MLTIVPVSFEHACQFVGRHHRHHVPPVGHKFSIGVKNDKGLCGVAIVGRPVARMRDDRFTLEVTRLCTDGTPTPAPPSTPPHGVPDGPWGTDVSAPTFFSLRTEHR